MSNKNSLTIEIEALDDMIQTFETLNEKLQVKANKVAQALAEVGFKEAQVRFASAIYDFIDEGKTKPSDVTVRLTREKTKWVVAASGKNVAFIEFGAGVFFNGAEPYPEPRPSEVLGIGEYGEKKGRNPSWIYKDVDGEKHRSFGTPAQMPMYHSFQKMKAEFESRFKEILLEDD